MLKSSKFRLFLAGLTAAALIGGVMAADPADAGKKKKKRAKAKSSKVVQVSKGGKAKAGNGGNGGNGGNSGMVNNTGNVGGGGGVVLAPGLSPFEAECVQDAFLDIRDTEIPNGVITAGPELVAFQAAIGAAGCNAPADVIACLNAQAADSVPSPLLNQGEVIGCLRGDGLPGPAPVPVPGPTGGGSVFSGDAGSGATGGTGGNATGGAGGNNSNNSTVTVTRDDHSIDAG